MKKNLVFAPTEVKIALIGGGTGSFTLLSALKNHTSQIAALVNMVDDGGSTGILRDELGVLPPGDIRQCLVALSRSSNVRDLFNYRFDSGSMKGHTFGNLFLSALEKMTGSFADGVKLASQVLNIVGTVEPITLTNTSLVIEKDDGTVVRGQYNIEIDDLAGSRPKIWLDPVAKANPRALAAIDQADIVVIAPGGLYYSLAPALTVRSIGRALANTKAPKVYVCNLMNNQNHTNNYRVTDYASEIERFIGKPVLDYVLYNIEKPGRELVSKYAREGEKPVPYSKKDFQNAHYQAVGRNLLSSQIWKVDLKSDLLAKNRTLIRHDSEAVARSIMDIYYEHAHK